MCLRGCFTPHPEVFIYVQTRSARHQRLWAVHLVVIAAHLLKGDVSTLRGEAQSQLRKVLVVMPEGGPVGWYSNWWNHGKGGRPAWESFHLRELPRLLEGHYGAGTRRAIAGLSMGGFGALSYAARNPGMFKAAASYSGVVHPLLPGWPEGMMGLLADFGEDPLALWGDPEAQRRIWKAHDPYYLAKRLRHTRVFLSVGNGHAGPFDPPGTFDDLEAILNEMNLALAPRLRHAGVPLTTDFYGPGTHDWPYWERGLHRSLPLLLSALRVDCKPRPAVTRTACSEG